jgi:general secretion pathway protein G
MARGFTLIELLVTVSIVAILASAALPLNELTVKRAKEQDLRRSLREIREALDAYKQASEDGRIVRTPEASGYPKRLEDLVEGVEDRRSQTKRRMYFLRRIPRDPLADPSLPAAETWGKRSYSSPPDEPAPGDDVYDVYSLAAGVGINGRPYKEW